MQLETRVDAALLFTQYVPSLVVKQLQGDPSVSVPQSSRGMVVHTRHLPTVHKAEAQSWRLAQVCPIAQREQDPPQSMSVSVPFLTPSVQETPQMRGVVNRQVWLPGGQGNVPQQSGALQHWPQTPLAGQSRVPAGQAQMPPA